MIHLKVKYIFFLNSTQKLGKNNEKNDQDKNDSPNIQETPKENDNTHAYDDFQTKLEEKPNDVELEEDNIIRNIEKNSPKKFESMHSKDLLSEIKSEVRNLDAGYDTLSLIDQIEMFNSLNSSFLNKNSTERSNSFFF